jgi:hypothetical protein
MTPSGFKPATLQFYSAVPQSTEPPHNIIRQNHGFRWIVCIYLWKEKCVDYVRFGTLYVCSLAGHLTEIVTKDFAEYKPDLVAIQELSLGEIITVNQQEL